MGNSMEKAQALVYAKLAILSRTTVIKITVRTWEFMEGEGLWLGQRLCFKGHNPQLELETNWQLIQQFQNGQYMLLSATPLQ